MYLLFCILLYFMCYDHSFVSPLFFIIYIIYNQYNIYKINQYINKEFNYKNEINRKLLDIDNYYKEREFLINQKFKIIINKLNNFEDYQQIFNSDKIDNLKNEFSTLKLFLLEEIILDKKVLELTNRVDNIERKLLKL